MEGARAELYAAILRFLAAGLVEGRILPPNYRQLGFLRADDAIASGEPVGAEDLADELLYVWQIIHGCAVLAGEEDPYAVLRTWSEVFEGYAWHLRENGRLGGTVTRWEAEAAANRRVSEDSPEMARHLRAALAPR